MLLHLAHCRDCALNWEQLSRVRTALKSLPARRPPEELTMALRVLASRERVRRLLRRSPAAMLAYLAERVWLWCDNLMRPVALPAAGGLVSALLLFSILLPSIAFHHSSANDVPLLGLYRDATIQSTAPFGFNDDDFVLEVMVDNRGRMVDYSITEGDCLRQDIRLRRSIENNLLFTGFTPATSFGQPTYGKVFVSFSKIQYNVAWPGGD